MASGPTLANLSASGGVIRGLIAAVTIVGGLTCQLSAADDPEPVRAEIGGPAPTFSVQHLDGYWQAWTNFFGEAGLLIVFVTKETSDELGPHAAGGWSGRALPVLLIDTTCGADPEELQSTYPEASESLSLRFDPRGDIARLFDVPSVPHAVAVDRHGDIVFMGGLGRTPDEILSVKRALDAIADRREPASSRASAGGTRRFKPYCMPDTVPPN